MYESGSNMEPFKKISSIVTPLDRVNVDTDQIVPKQFLKLVHRTGFGKFLFYNWRFDADGKPKQDFVLNHPKYSDIKVHLIRHWQGKVGHLGSRSGKYLDLEFNYADVVLD